MKKQILWHIVDVDKPNLVYIHMLYQELDSARLDNSPFRPGLIFNEIQWAYFMTTLHDIFIFSDLPNINNFMGFAINVISIQSYNKHFINKE